MIEDPIEIPEGRSITIGERTFIPYEGPWPTHEEVFYAFMTCGGDLEEPAKSEWNPLMVGVSLGENECLDCKPTAIIDVKALLEREIESLIGAAEQLEELGDTLYHLLEKVKTTLNS